MPQVTRMMEIKLTYDLHYPRNLRIRELNLAYYSKFLLFAHWFYGLNDYTVTGVVFAIFIMGLEFLGNSISFLVLRMAFSGINLNYDGLNHLIRYHHAD